MATKKPKRADELTKQEKENLSSYISDVDADVFVISNLNPEVVGAALQQRKAELFGRYVLCARQSADQGGHVLGDELLLEVDRVGGDDDACVVVQGVEGCREQVGEGLAHAGAGLDDEALLLVDGVGHGAGHLEAAVPRDAPDIDARGTRVLADGIDAVPDHELGGGGRERHRN